jgi:hypothetical protein
MEPVMDFFSSAIQFGAAVKFGFSLVGVLIVVVAYLVTKEVIRRLRKRND